MNQWWCNAGPALQTLDQHYTVIELTSRVSWASPVVCKQWILWRTSDTLPSGGPPRCTGDSGAGRVERICLEVCGERCVARPPFQKGGGSYGGRPGSGFCWRLGAGLVKHHPRGTVASHFPGHVILAASLSSLYIYTLSPPLLFLLSSILSFISPLLYPLLIPYSSLPLSIVFILFSLT